MGLDLSRLDLGALAAAAGQGIGNLGLDVPDWGAYGRNFAASQLAQQQLAQDQYKTQALLALQQSQDEEAMKREQLKALNSLGLEQYKQDFSSQQKGMDRDLDMRKALMSNMMRQQELEQQKAYQSGQLDISRGNLAVNQDQLGVDAAYKSAMLGQNQEKEQHDMYFKTAEAMAKLDDKQREQLSSFSGIVGILAKNNPDAVPIALDYGVAQGFFNQDQAEALKKLPPEQQQAMGLMYASAGSHAVDFARQMYGSKKGSDGGISITENPDGSREINIGAENKVQAQAQQNLVDTLKNLDSLKQIVKDYDPNFLTAAGGLKAKAGKALAWLDLGKGTEDMIKTATGGAIDPKAVKKYARDYYKFTSQIAAFKMNFIKAMSGLSYTDKQMEAMEDAIMTEGDDPASFYGKAQGLSAMMETTLKTVQQVSNGKLPANTPEFQQKFSEQLQNNIAKELEARSIPGVMIDGDWFTSEQIKAYANAHKKSVREVLEKERVFQ